jgi:hypothetical protein
MPLGPTLFPPPPRPPRPCKDEPEARPSAHQLFGLCTEALHHRVRVNVDSVRRFLLCSQQSAARHPALSVRSSCPRLSPAPRVILAIAPLYSCTHFGMRICSTHVRVLSPLGHLRRHAQTYARCQLTVTSHICIFLSRGVIKRFHMQPNAVLFVFLGLVCHLVAVLSRPPPLPPILLSLLSRAGRWGAFSGGFAAIAYLVLSRYPAMDQSNNVSRLILPHHSTG